jgi:hypothetical protein
LAANKRNYSVSQIILQVKIIKAGKTTQRDLPAFSRSFIGRQALTK